MNFETKFEKLSAERKKLAEEGKNPVWLTTPAWQMIKDKYLTKEDNNLRKTFHRISKVCASHLDLPDDEKQKWQDKFFRMMWKGDLALSTPILSNLGTDKGMPVSCTGNISEDSVYSFYNTTLESAVLSQEGFGTSTYLGYIRPRGSKISRGGTASGVLPVIKQFVQMSRDITQGVRRGAWAGYLEITHGDFWEVINYLEHNPQDLNIGWLITDEFIENLKNNDEDSLNRYKRALKVKLVTGKGYFFFIDRANRNAPEEMKKHGLVIKASNLCAEISLPASEEESFTCILSSVNLSNYDDWDENLVFDSIVFLDCVVSEFLERAKKIKGLEKVVRSTERSRSLGLGALGFHTYLQKKRIAFESLEASYFNSSVFKHIKEESERASKWLATMFGEPEYCKGSGRRNLCLRAIAPNTSSALIAGSVSPGIEPFYANAFVQPVAGGEVNRVNPILIDIMKERNVYNQETINDILFNDGSVQHVTWLDDDEKQVFKTAFEINQKVLLRLASIRQTFIDQAQSLNLFFPAGTEEEYISEVHKQAFLDKNIKSLYYIRSNSSNKASKDDSCSACAS